MFTLNCKGSLFTIDQPQIMGIINATPDSFYSGSRTSSIDIAVEMAAKMISEGASILDIGGQSTRPNASIISEEEELSRVLPVIKAIHSAFPSTYLSIDSYYPSVVIEAINAGASLVNDVSGGRFYTNMLSTVAALKVPYICMHSTGDIKNMHDKKEVNNITLELVNYFIERIAACNKAGIIDIIIDPGFGFGKTISNNFTLLKELSALQILNKPLLLGVSRKSTIYKTIGTTAEESLNGTTVLNTIGLMNKASILRVHDVKEASEAIKLVNSVQGIGH